MDDDQRHRLDAISARARGDHAAERRALDALATTEWQQHLRHVLGEVGTVDRRRPSRHRAGAYLNAAANRRAE